MYSISNYASMVEDRIRMDAYLAALRGAITPGCTVLDIGTGTGAMAILAVRAGAGRVVAVEPSDAIHVARQVAAANGCADRIEFIHGLSTQVEMPIAADVIVSDLRGVIPLLGAHIPSIIDARERFLAPGGTLIPMRDTLWCALVDAPALYAKHFRGTESRPYGLDMSRVSEILSHTWRKGGVGAEQLVSTPGCWGVLEYASIASPDVSRRVSLAVERDGAAHGLSLWFDAEISTDAGFSNAPGQPEAIYGQAYFPFPRPVSLLRGDRAEITLRAKLVGDDYVWWWSSLVERDGSAEPVAAFDQSTFHAAAVDVRTLLRSERSYVPRLRRSGAVDRFILSRMDAGGTLGEISNEAAAAFPDVFPDPERALTHVGELSRRSSE
jgi:type I protein arginine methyltransferase